MPTVSLSIVDIIILMLGAIVLGITIHFFITSRRNLKSTFTEPKKNDLQVNEWKLRYFNEVEVKDRELASLRKRLEEVEENNNINSIEAEENRNKNKKLVAELEAVRKNMPQGSAGNTAHRPDYFEQLKLAQESLLDHNEKINQLLSNIDVIRDTEEKQKEILRDNQELTGQIEELRSRLFQKEQEISNIREKANLSKEMSSMLDNAYTEFGALQEKMQKLETQVNSSKMINMDYEDIKEEHLTLRNDYEEQRTKLHAVSTENRELQADLQEAEEKLKEVNLQRQQLQKRVAYLEDLNHDLQAVSDANKRLEGQIKRIGELESMINVIAEERDELMRRKS